MRKLVGRNVQRFRLASGLTQEQLAEKAGHSQQYISGLERGARNPTVVSLFELAEALKVTPADLVAPDQQGGDSQRPGDPANRSDSCNCDLPK